jgi:hypothetical protein
MAVRLSALRAGRRLPPKKIPGTYFCYRLSLSQGHSGAERLKLKKSTSSRLDPSTFRLVTWCLNQLRYRVPPMKLKQNLKNYLPYILTSVFSLSSALPVQPKAHNKKRKA